MTSARVCVWSLFGLSYLNACSAAPLSDGTTVTSDIQALSAQTISAQMTLPWTLGNAALLVAQNKVQLDSGVSVVGAVWSAGTVSMQPDVKAQTVTCRRSQPPNQLLRRHLG